MTKINNLSYHTTTTEAEGTVWKQLRETSIFQKVLNKMEEKLCMYSKFGFCKFKHNCRRKHYTEECYNSNCKDKNTCQKRHPKNCKKLLFRKL